MASGLTGIHAVGDSQFAFEKCGTEQIIHRVRQLLRRDASTHAVLVDCRNAFNTIRRKAIRDVLMSNPHLVPLRALFNAMYVEQSELIVRGAGLDCAVICGSEGVRQGDVLGPLLFCVGLKPILERTQSIFAERHPQLVMHLFAYMDDITIVGTEDACAAAFRILKVELEEGLSLMVNNEKTVSTSPSVGSAIGCSVSACPKLLGAFVGRRWEEEKVFLDPLPLKHEALFARLPRLPSEIAYRLLVRCGIPMWAHLVRTHEPDAVREASLDFTGMATRCLADIVGVDYNEMDGESFRQTTLPAHRGGMGVLNWAELADGAYRASLKCQWLKELVDPTTGEEVERAEEEAPAPPEFPPEETDAARPLSPRVAPIETIARSSLWEMELASLKVAHPKLHANLNHCKTALGSAWLHTPISVASSHSSKVFACAVLARLRWAGGRADEPTVIACRCGYPQRNVASSSTRDVMMHMLGCARNGGATRRHHMLRDAIASLLTRAGYTVACEVPLELAEDPLLRMDIVCYPPGRGQTIFIDTTVLNSAAKRQGSRDVQSELGKKDAEKFRKYGLAAQACGAKLLPFAVDIYGVMSADCRSFLSTIVAGIRANCVDLEEKETITLNATVIPALSRALAFGNGT